MYIMKTTGSEKIEKIMENSKHRMIEIYSLICVTCREKPHNIWIFIQLIKNEQAGFEYIKIQPTARRRT